ncbi:MAG: CcdB family protein [Spirochaeta sp.]|jgi:toxin CcdB|nr:CcdB family protein [Spirochaeta sp.]
MAQFDLHTNTNRNTRTRTPYLLDVQSDATSVLPTRVVCPVRPESALSATPIDRVHLVVSVEMGSFVIFVTELTAVPVGVLGPVVSSLQAHRQDVVSAIDLLITGF